jgi:hypothetical protein
MDEQRRQRRTLGDLSGFHLPPGISVCKQALSYGWAYVFRHHSLGQLGRIVLRETSDRRTHLSCEVAGDAKDPMTADRMALFNRWRSNFQGAWKVAETGRLRLRPDGQIRRHGLRSPRN